MFAAQNINRCDIPYLDCRGFYDLISQIIGLFLAAVILYGSLVNYRELKLQKNDRDDTEYEHSLRRKIRVNLLNIIFLIMLIGSIIFSMALFQEASENKTQDIIQHQLEKWYKVSEIMFVQLLNGLLLAVGLLYWHGLYFFFQVKDVTPPIIFGKVAKFLLLLCGVYCIFTLLFCSVFIFLKDDNDAFMVNLLILISSGVSMTLFIFYRMSYYKNIFRSIRLGKKVIYRQRIYNILIIFSSMARMTLCTLEMNGVSSNSLRNYNNDCYDVSPYHAIILLGITAAVNLLPSFVFSNIFTTLQRQRRTHETDSNQTLFSAQPSELVS